MLSLTLKIVNFNWDLFHSGKIVIKFAFTNSKEVICMVLLDTLPMSINNLFEKHGLLVKVEKGSHIFQEGEIANDVFLIKSGIIQINKETETGKELTIRICSTNSIIGEFILFDKSIFNSTTAKALSSSELFTISKNKLEMLLTEQPALMIEYLKWLQNENFKSQTRLRDLVLNGKKGALFSTLIRLANTYGEPIDANKVFINFNLTNTELANLCATTREMVNRMLNDLKKHEIITFDKGYITILDLEYIKEEISCENCPLSICRID